MNFNLYPSRCDLNLNCDDGSDEKDCKSYNKDSKCHEHQFMCSNGQCIDGNSLCDGFHVSKNTSNQIFFSNLHITCSINQDCSEGEDELMSNCRKSKSRTCNENEFKCSNNQCIPKAWVCDGASDCSNDEENCRK